MPVLLDTAAAEWLFDEQYSSFVRACISRARQRILAQQFVVDARPEEDELGEVRYLLHGLAEAAHRGVDVRVLLAEVLVERPLAVDINEPPARFLIKRGVQVRRYPAALGVQMHAKALVVDDAMVITGGHNWTPSAFRINAESSLVLRSEACAAYVSERFESLWSKADDYGNR
jgi:phosphatidylserine/phosphatidylglycerophosphate/cardiolipin synthase-like enzyme